MFAVGLLATAACGAESEKTSSSGGSGGDSSGSGGSSGSSGSAGVSPTGGANQGGGGTTPSGGAGSGTAGLGGSAGSGGGSKECGALTCDPVLLPGDFPPIEACCATDGRCGLDGSALEPFGVVLVDPCQPRDQPGEVDSECASSPAATTDFGMLSFEGCCTPAGHCGYLIDDAFNLVALGLGCVEAAAVANAVPASCTPGE